MNEQHKFYFCGWILFILCAIFYLISGLKGQDWISVSGSVVFLLACFIFLIPLIREMRGNCRRDPS